MFAPAKTLEIDGRQWAVEARLPGNSHALIMFRTTGLGTARYDRYITWPWPGKEASQVNMSLSTEQVMAALDDATLRRLFHRSLPVAGGPVASLR